MSKPIKLRGHARTHGGGCVKGFAEFFNFLHRFSSDIEEIVKIKEGKVIGQNSTSKSIKFLIDRQKIVEVRFCTPSGIQKAVVILRGDQNTEAVVEKLMKACQRQYSAKGFRIISPFDKDQREEKKTMVSEVAVTDGKRQVDLSEGLPSAPPRLVELRRRSSRTYKVVTEAAALVDGYFRLADPEPVLQANKLRRSDLNQLRAAGIASEEIDGSWLIELVEVKEVVRLKKDTSSATKRVISWSIPSDSIARFLTADPRRLFEEVLRQVLYRQSKEGKGKLRKREEIEKSKVLMEKAIEALMEVIERINKVLQDYSYLEELERIQVRQ